MLKEIEFEYVNVFGVKFKFYKPVIEDLVGRRFDYINVEDNGNTVRLGNDKEEFSFYDYNLTETFVGFCESLKSSISSAKLTTSIEDEPWTEVCITVNPNKELWRGGSESLSFSWASDNVKLTYVPKGTKK